LVINLPVQLAEANSPGNGLGAFNLNVKSFLFQLATFVIVLLVLRRWVFPKLVHTLEERRKVLEDSLLKAKQTEEKLAEAEAQAEQIILKARQQADAALAEARSGAKEVLAKAESAAGQQAARLIKDAQEHLAQESNKLRAQLKGELANLVVLTTEKVLRKKLDGPEDARLIEQSIKELR